MAEVVQTLHSSVFELEKPSASSFRAIQAVEEENNPEENGNGADGPCHTHFRKGFHSLGEK